MFETEVVLDANARHSLTPVRPVLCAPTRVRCSRTVMLRTPTAVTETARPRTKATWGFTASRLSASSTASLDQTAVGMAMTEGAGAAAAMEGVTKGAVLNGASVEVKDGRGLRAVSPGAPVTP